jgi:hypothetical protein
MEKTLYEELHETATSLNNEKHNAEYISIVNEARRAAGNGSLYITRSAISQAVINKLRSEGLRVEHDPGGDQRDPYPSYYKILWDRPHKAGSGMSA